MKIWKPVAALTVASLLGGLFSLGGAEESVREVKVAAKRFKFVPSRIKIKQGQTLHLELYSQDVKHGFRILGTDIETKIPPRGRGSVRVTLPAQEKGKYPFQCSHKCGAGHSSMRGVIIVQ